MKWPVAVIVLVYLLCGGGEKCWGVQPYENVPGPQGAYLEMYPIYYSASRLNDKNGNALTTNLGFTLYENVAEVLYYNQSLFTNSVVAGIALPAGYTELLGDHDTGFGDVTMVVGYWLIDDPESKTWLAAGSYLDAPTGSFDKNKRANMGMNVWKIRPTIVLAKQFGPMDLELTTKYNIYTKNQDTGIRQGDEMITEGYLGYLVQPGLMVGANLNATFGGDSIVNGARIPDSGVQIFQAGPSIFKMFGQVGVSVGWLTDFGVRNSMEGYQVVARICWKLL